MLRCRHGGTGGLVGVEEVAVVVPAAAAAGGGGPSREIPAATTSPEGGPYEHISSRREAEVGGIPDLNMETEPNLDYEENSASGAHFIYAGHE